MGAGTAFLTGFVDAANQSRYEKRMAEHEESIQDRADFTWKERDGETRARVLEDQKTEAGTQTARDIAQAGLQATAATALAGTQTARDIAQAGFLTTAAGLVRTDDLTDQTRAEEKAIEQLTEQLIAITPSLADNPEALARALQSGEEGLFLVVNSGFRYDPDGSLISKRDIIDRDTKAYVMANAPLSWRGNEDAWMLTEAAIEFAEMVRKEGGRTGRVAFNDAEKNFEDILDEDGNVIGARIVRPAAEGPEQYRLTAADNEEFIDLKREAYNSFNRIMKLTLGENNVPLTPGVYTSVVEGVTGLAAAAYSNAQTRRIPGTNPSLSFDTTFKAMFGEKHEDLRQLDDAHLAIGANAIAAYVADPTSLSNLPAAELLEIYENIRVRNKVTLNVPNVDLTEQRGTFVLNDILRDIEANPGFITEYGSDEQRTALAELAPAITPVIEPEPVITPVVALGDGPTEPIGSSVGINRSVGVKQNPRDVNPEDALSFEGDDALARMFRAEEAWNEAKIEADARATVKSQELGKVIDAYHTPLIEFIKREFGLNDASNRQLKQLEKQFNDARGGG